MRVLPTPNRRQQAGELAIQVVPNVPLPQAQNRPALLCQFRCDGYIAGAVAGKFGFPIVYVGSGGAEAFGVAVPEVAVYEDGDFLAPKHNVGLAGESFDVRGEVDFAGRFPIDGRGNG